jgi:hypothetical protein
MSRLNYFLILLFSISCLSLHGQDFPTTEKEFAQQYRKNIRKTRLNGVYIPSDIKDAMVQLEKKTQVDALEKFKNAPVEEVAPKLHFGIGRWMIVNWNFDEGSRLSHKLVKMGVTNPDDMAQFLIVSFHKHLNGQDLDIEERAQKYVDAKKRKQEEERQNGTRETISVKKIEKKN